MDERINFTIIQCDFIHSSMQGASCGTDCGTDSNLSYQPHLSNLHKFLSCTTSMMILNNEFNKILIFLHTVVISRSMIELEEALL